jgi:methionyl-tRNA synthetase
MEIFVAVAWPYANGELHLGHFTGSLLAPDIFARFHRQKGNDVLMVSGTDMHGSPIEVAAEDARIEPADFANKIHELDVEIIKRCGISFNLYTTTDTETHKEASQSMFMDLYDKKLLFKKKVKQYWSAKEKKFLLDRFIEGECPHCHYEGARGDQCEKCGRALESVELINPRSRSGDRDLELRESEDIFIDLPKLQKDIAHWLSKHPNIKGWKGHVLSFTNAWLKEGLKARPVTRDLTYGVPLPKSVDIKNSDKKLIYVWFEAVIGYWSAAIEWSKRTSGAIKDSDKDIIFLYTRGQTKSWRNFWNNKACKHYYFMGKDNIWFHTIWWPAILIGWNKGKKDDEVLQLPYDVPANAWLNLEGDKMSKSRNWFVELGYLLDNYGQDLVRFYFTLRMPENRDSDFKWKDFVDVNNNELVANLGNFVHRSLTFIESSFNGEVPGGRLENEVRFEIRDAFCETEILLEKVKFAESLGRIFKLVSFANKYFDKKAVWKVVKKDKHAGGDILYNCVQLIEALRILLSPFLPNAVEKLSRMLGQEEIGWAVGKDNWRFKRIRAGQKLGEVEILFKKLEDRVAEEEKTKLGMKK